MTTPKTKFNIEKYSPSGYPKNNANFTREANRLLKSRRADLKKVDRYFQEVSVKLEENLPKKAV